MLMSISEDDFDNMAKDPATGQPRMIEGYPLYFTPSKRLYPLPMPGIEMIYG